MAINIRYYLICIFIALHLHYQNKTRKEKRYVNWKIQQERDHERGAQVL